MTSDKNKIKVVWLCHFSNSELNNLFKKNNAEFAPWINELIKLFEGDNRFNLYIIAPNYHTNKIIKFNVRGVNYIFYKHRLSFLRITAFKKLFFYLNFEQLYYRFIITSRINKIVTNVDPDLVHLHGAENPIYSWGALPLRKRYPVLVTIQGFIGRASTVNSKIKIRIRLENKIVRIFKHFGVRTKEMEEDILKVNPSAKTHWHNYPINKPPIFQEEDKTFDCVFFARVIKDKGIEDLIHALGIVKREINSISLRIVGPVNHSYKQYLTSLIEELNLTDNVSFAGYFEKQDDMYRYVGQAKVCVLPTYHDIIPGTIIESMYMKLPVIAYAVGGIPEINEDHENIGLVKLQDISGLATKIIELLNNRELRNTLAIGAYNYTLKRFVNTDIPNDLYNIYNEVIKDFSSEKTH